ncbi:hypothetical protein [Mycobacterium sp. DL440]|uniref:hypothetical protein n=1 Tax=Mycobacterium sp. DL440 TaxID=2675523 RepID=UPI00142369E5|nr:hypothetical protein [Mycobacterium sp. DL440]
MQPAEHDILHINDIQALECWERVNRGSTAYAVGAMSVNDYLIIRRGRAWLHILQFDDSRQDSQLIGV